jgi:hypothetical protein
VITVLDENSNVGVLPLGINHVKGGVVKHRLYLGDE